MNLGDFDIGIKVFKAGGFVMVWRTAAGDTQERILSNRTTLGHALLIEAVPQVRGELPRIDETIDIHAPHSRRQGDS